VDKAKLDVIDKPPPLVNVKGILLAPHCSYFLCINVSGNFQWGVFSLESVPGCQVIKIKTDKSEYRTQGTNVSLN